MLTLWWGFPTLIMRANLSDIGPILRGEIPEEALSIVLIRPMSDAIFFCRLYTTISAHPAALRVPPVRQPQISPTAVSNRSQSAAQSRDWLEGSLSAAVGRNRKRPRSTRAAMSSIFPRSWRSCTVPSAHATAFPW